MTFRQQLQSSTNCCLLSSARGRHREQQIVVDMAQLVAPLVSVHDTLTLLSKFSQLLTFVFLTVTRVYYDKTNEESCGIS